MRLHCLAPGKVNLCLFLGETRPDGRHELVTLFQALSLADELELETLPVGSPDEVICPGVEGPNLAATALAALRARGWAGPPVRISIAKRLPVAAGMAGGSADAAAVLRLAISIAPGRPEELDRIAAELGADVPSQLMPGLAIGTGAGELVEPYEALAPHAFVIVPSEHALATADVFREADRLGLPRPAADLEDAYARLGAALNGPPPRLPDGLLVNDLEAATVSLHPPVAVALEDARGAGADQALVCGSGPTVAGVFWGPDGAGRAEAAADALRGRHPRVIVATPVTAELALPVPA